MTASSSAGGGPEQPRLGEGAERFSHSGYRYLLGFGRDFFGIWDRETPGGPVERFPRTDEGWAQAWGRFSPLEPRAIEVRAEPPSHQPEAAEPVSASPPVSGTPPVSPPVSDTPPVSPPDPARPAAAVPPVGEGALRFSHSGFRYLLGYGSDFFGIWDRQGPGGPVLRFDRTDQGWNEAWNRFTAWEPRAVEVPAGGFPRADTQPPARSYRSTLTRAQWTVALVAAAALVAGVSIVLWAVHVNALHRFHQGTATLADLQTTQDDASAGQNLAFAMILPTAVAWLLWQHRAQANLRSLGAAGLKYSPGWAVGWWFVPFANVVMPFNTVRELWKASDPSAGAIDWRARGGATLVGLWWGAWLVAGLLTRVSAGVSSDPRTGATSALGAGLLMASDAALIVGAVLAIRVVRGVQARQERKRAHLPSATEGVAAAP